ncbi:MAG: phosphodiester glycosidase family protein [Lachnospiraceae bacterium]|nr:phosphodiester glycosidase family protein [Lachnospiraceae bacterium]
MEEKQPISKRILANIGRFFACIGTVIAGVLVILLLSMNVICNGGSDTAREIFVSTILETGALKFLASWYLTTDEINEIVEKNSMGEFNEEVDTHLITVVAGNEEVNKGSVSSAGAGQATTITYSGAGTAEYEEVDEDGDGIILYKVAGRNFFGTMMVVLDPSRVTLESYYNQYKKGAPLDVIVSEYNGVAGINGGIYHQSEAGGRPFGVTVSHGEIQTNKPQEDDGLVLIALTYDNILIVENISELDEAGVEQLVKEKKIRDGCCFQEEFKDENNHFVQLVINGKPRELNGNLGSGYNPRTAIGQRADGALLLFVTDGRGAAGHLGASASDLIEIMAEYGAVNAANLDGGSSSSMVMNGEYLMDSVTFRKANTSWNLPIAFVVK